MRCASLRRVYVGGEALTAELAARLEASIREAPEQYFWFHRRWKSKPKAEPDAPDAGDDEDGDEL